ncbi:MAG TPA: hypothetical protein VGC28_06380 [Sphingomonas sp.]
MTVLTGDPTASGAMSRWSRMRECRNGARSIANRISTDADLESPIESITQPNRAKLGTLGSAHIDGAKASISSEAHQYPGDSKSGNRQRGQCKCEHLPLPFYLYGASFPEKRHESIDKMISNADDEAIAFPKVLVGVDRWLLRSGS